MDIEPHDAYTNMAVDEALLEGQIRGGSLPTIRFYSWRPPAISLGYSQKSCIHPDELAQVEKLCSSKYSSQNWNFFGGKKNNPGY